SASRLPFRAGYGAAKQSFAAVRSQAELGNEKKRELVPPPGEENGGILPPGNNLPGIPSDSPFAGERGVSVREEGYHNRPTSFWQTNIFAKFIISTPIHRKLSPAAELVCPTVWVPEGGAGPPLTWMLTSLCTVGCLSAINSARTCPLPACRPRTWIR